MKNTILISNGFYELADLCCKKIAQKAHPNNREVLVVVPDRFSFFVEKNILNYVDCYFNIKVVGLNYLCKMLCDNAQCLTSLSQCQLVFQAAKSVGDQFEYFSKNITQKLAADMQTAINLFMANDLSSEQLFCSGDDVSDKKFRDLSRVFSAYKCLLGQQLDQNQLFSIALKNAKNNQFFNQKDVFFVGFDDLTKQALNLLCVAAEQSNECIVCVCAPNEGQKNSYLFDSILLEKVKRVFQSNNIDYCFEISNNNLPCAAGILTNNPQTQFAKHISVFRPKTQTEEVEILTREIVVLCKHEGVETGDICVCCSNLDLYKDIISQHFLLSNIPHFIDKEKDIKHTFCANYLLQIFQAKVRGYDKNFFSFLIDQQDFCAQQKNDMKNQMNFYNFEFSRKNQFLNNLKKSQKNCENWQKMLKKQQKIDNYLKNHNFSNIFDEDFESVFNNFLSEICDEEQQNFQRVAFDECKKMIENVQQVCQQNKLDFDDIFQIFCSQLENIQIAQPPVCKDDVFVGDLADSFFEKKKYCFFVGQTSNLTFRMQPESSLVRDDDILALKKIATIGPSVAEVCTHSRAKSLFNILQQTQTVFFSAPLFDHDGSSLSASVVFDWIKSNFNCKNLLREYSIYNLLNKTISPQTATRLFFSPKSTSIVAQKLSEIDEAKSIALAAKQALGQTDKTQCVVKNFAINRNLSSSFFETYFSCPFKAFATYGLALNEQPKPIIQAKDVGNCVHYVLQNVLSKNNLTTDEQTEKCAEQYFYEFAHKNFSHLDNRIVGFEIKKLLQNIKKLAKLLVFEQKISKYAPKEFEKFVCQQDFFDGQKLVGFVDRVDFCGNKARIVDYKTGEIDASLSALFFGEKLQLFLYAALLSEPLSGMLYCNIKSIFADNFKTIYSGFFTQDPDDVFSQDCTVLDGGKSKVLPVEISGKGSDLLIKSKSAFTYEQLQDMMRYAKNLCLDACNLINSGFIARTPLQKDEKPMCERCKFKSLCSFCTPRLKSDFAIDDDQMLGVFKNGGDLHD